MKNLTLKIKRLLSVVATTLYTLSILSSCHADAITKEEDSMTYCDFKNKYSHEPDLIPSTAKNIYYAQFLDGMVPRGSEYMRFDLNKDIYNAWINKYNPIKNRDSQMIIEQPCTEIGKLNFWPLTLSNAEKSFFSIQGSANEIYNISVYSSKKSDHTTVYIIIKYI